MKEINVNYQCRKFIDTNSLIIFGRTQGFDSSSL